MQTLDPTIVVETKLHPPPLRAGLVPRDPPRGRSRRRRPRVVVVCAPAGYGKTTVLAQYAPPRRAAARVADPRRGRRRPGAPAAWSSRPPWHASRPVDPRVFRSLRGSDRAIERVVLPGLVNGFGAAPDDRAPARRPAPGERSRPASPIIAFLAEHVPASARLLVASRDASSLPLGRHAGAWGRARDHRRGSGTRARRRWAVSWRRPECPSTTACSRRSSSGPRAGRPPSPSSSSPFRRQPIGGPSVADLIAGDDRDVVDYFSSELLSRQSPERLSFLLQTSILERLSAPLCDDLLDRDDSASMIAGLEDEHLFLLPLDRAREWYRYHHLFRDVLRGGAGPSRPGGGRAPCTGEPPSGTTTTARPRRPSSTRSPAATWLRRRISSIRHSRLLLNTGRLFTLRRWIERLLGRRHRRLGAARACRRRLVGLLGEKEPRPPVRRVRRTRALAGARLHGRDLARVGARPPQGTLRLGGGDTNASTRARRPTTSNRSGIPPTRRRRSPWVRACSSSGGPMMASPCWRRRRHSGRNGARPRSSPLGSSPRSPWTRGGWTRPKRRLSGGSRSPISSGSRNRPPAPPPARGRCLPRRSTRRPRARASTWRWHCRYWRECPPGRGGRSRRALSSAGRPSRSATSHLAAPLLEQARRELVASRMPASFPAVCAQGNARSRTGPEAAACSPSVSPTPSGGCSNCFRRTFPWTRSRRRSRSREHGQELI